MHRFFFQLRRTTLFMFLLVMPIGIRVDPQHPNEFSISGHAGTGQVVSVLRDCDGNVTASEESTFVDLAASMQLSHRFDNGVFTILGVRSGRLDASGRFPTRNYDYDQDGYVNGSYEREVSYRYVNPHLALEDRHFGIGAGYLSGEVPTIFGETGDTLPFSAHLRLGNYSAANFQISLNEDLPLASGTGYYKMGVGYPAGSGMWLFTGLSAGFYEDLGLVQQVALPLSDRFDLDLSTRLGVVDGTFAGGASLGVRYHLPFGNSELSPEDIKAAE